MRAVVASANLSRNSEEWLKEAGTESVEPKFLSAARSFVESLRGEIIGIDFAKKKISLYKPPKGEGGGGQKKPVGPALWVVNVEIEKVRSEEDKTADTLAENKAKSKLRDVNRFQLERIRYPADWPVKVGDYVVQHVLDGRKKYFAAPARANTIHRYVSRHRAQLVVVIEERKRLRARTPLQLRQWLRSRSLKFRVPATFKNVKRATLRRALFQLWPTMEEVTR